MSWLVIAKPICKFSECGICKPLAHQPHAQDDKKAKKAAKITLLFMIVGHTHNKLDRFFSRLCVKRKLQIDKIPSDEEDDEEEDEDDR